LPATPTPYHWGNLSDTTFSWAGSGDGEDSLKAGLPDSLDYSITITGGTISPVTLTWANLKAMNMVRITASMPKHDGSIVTSDWVGIPTTDILARAGLPEGSLTIEMTAPDEFGGAFTVDQLQGTMVGLIKNGTALDTNIDGKKPIQLVLPGQMGSNWIKVPTQITISVS
jgi:DMSO/TMAO reductase YedYZ molybdopterin-dependent catalytic subunit